MIVYMLHLNNINANKQIKWTKKRGYYSTSFSRSLFFPPTGARERGWEEERPWEQGWVLMVTLMKFNFLNIYLVLKPFLKSSAIQNSLWLNIYATQIKNLQSNIQFQCFEELWIDLLVKEALLCQCKNYMPGKLTGTSETHSYFIAHTIMKEFLIPCLNKHKFWKFQFSLSLISCLFSVEKIC